MEHILPVDGAQHISVPYVGAEEYDGGPFKEYLNRKGWKQSGTGDLIFGTRTPEEKVAFLQTYLYFGLLITLFGEVGIHVRTSAFVDRSTNSITTQALPHFISEWIKVEGLWNGVPLSSTGFPPKTLRAYTIREYLNWTRFYLQDFMNDAQYAQSAAHNSLPLVELSIKAIGETLSTAWLAIYDASEPGMPTWGPSQYLRDRLRRSGWCPSSTPFFPAALVTSSISADYFFGSSPPPGPPKNHSQCSELVCSANQTTVDTKNYHAVHTATCRGCEFIRAPKEMADIVGKGEIPVMRWHNDALTVSTMDLSTKYVSISHVWSDGLGNDVDEKTNSLPKCQLTRIQGIVNRLYIEQHLLPGNVYGTGAFPSPNQEPSVGFWMDTLCVPIEEHHKNLRKVAIRMMREIYGKADRVLVLDSFVQGIPRSSDIIHKFTRIHLSNWHHRLWTLQEGQLTGSLFFQFQDGAQTFQDMAYPERNLRPTDVQQICSSIRFNCTTQLEAFYRLFRVLTESTEISKRMEICAKYVRTRTTTRIKDEALCVATILNLDPGPLLSGIDSEKNRMERFYDLIGSFDSRIIFNDHLRLQTVGYRWAPESFLHQSPDLITMREGGIDMRPSVRLYPTGGGLPVEFPGFKLGDIRANLGHSFFIAAESHNVPQKQRHSWSAGSEKAWWKQWYKVDIKPDTRGKYPTLDPNLQYVVVMYSDLHPNFVPSPAILGTIASEWQQPLETVNSFTAGVAHSNMSLELQRSLSSENPRSWLPIDTTPDRIPVNFVCQATVDMPSQEALIDAKAAFEHESAWMKPATLLKKALSKIGSRQENSPLVLVPQLQLSPDLYPIRVTVYSRRQKWCIL